MTRYKPYKNKGQWMLNERVGSHQSPIFKKVRSDARNSTIAYYRYLKFKVYCTVCVYIKVGNSFTLVDKRYKFYEI